MATPLDQGSAPPVLGLGLVVTAKDDPGRRGVVVWSNGRGVKGHYRMFADDSYVIQTMAGAYAIGNDVGSWGPVPETEWSSIERVISASARWEPVTWDDPAENDDHGFALMAALLPPPERDRVFGNGDWPCDYLSLAKSVAEWLDESAVVANGSATNGVGVDPATDAQADNGTQTDHDAAGHVSATWRTCGAPECREMFAPCCDHCGCQLGDRTGHDDYCATDGCVGSSDASTHGAPEEKLRAIAEAALIDWSSELPTPALRAFHTAARPSKVVELLDAFDAQSAELAAARAVVEAAREVQMYPYAPADAPIRRMFDAVAAYDTIKEGK